MSGFFHFRGHRVWYRRVGPGPTETARAPLVLVPGGPGAPHDYMAPFAELLAARGRPAVLYDPLGSGGSDRPAGIDWSIDLYVDELRALTTALRLERIHLLGSSAGGMVGVTYAAARPAALASLILSSAPMSVPEYRAGILRLLDGLPPEVREPILAYERRPVPTPAFVRAWDQFRKRHLCRVPVPEGLTRALSRMNGEAFRRMKGDLLRYVGTLADFDMTGRLADVAVPTLITAGRHDSLLLELCERWRALLPDGRLRVFDDSSHMPYIEEPEAYVDAVARFLDEVEAARAT
jgi:proline-specific peptidase